MDFIWVEGKGTGFAGAEQVRQAVFVEEQGYSREAEMDSIDQDALHIIGLEEDVPVCTARLFLEKEGVYHIGRVAVLKCCRGKGYGLAAMRQMEEQAKKLGAKQLVLSAQEDKAVFYQKAGYSLTGETSLDEGQPHVGMVKNL